MTNDFISEPETPGELLVELLATTDLSMDDAIKQICDECEISQVELLKDYNSIDSTEEIEGFENFEDDSVLLDMYDDEDEEFNLAAVLG